MLNLLFMARIPDPRQAFSAFTDLEGASYEIESMHRTSAEHPEA